MMAFYIPGIAMITEWTQQACTDSIEHIISLIIVHLKPGVK